MSDLVVRDRLTDGERDETLALIDAAAERDGQSAVSEQGRLLLRGDARPGVRHLLLRDDDGTLVGYAQLDGRDVVEPPTGELVIHPGHRGRRHGRALGSALLAESGNRLRLWAHGGHAAARHLAQSLRLTPFRELRQLRRPLGGLGSADASMPPGVRLRTFRPGEDEDAWLAVNAAAFAHHPEQGSLTRTDLEARTAEPWFDPEGFFLAVPEDDEHRIIGFHWTKVHEAERLGEVYVVGVAPDAQGKGLGRALTMAGLRHLAADRSLPTAMLYVDADNAAAVRVYETLGFRTFETDLMYRTEH
ncbi:mycothiol synthase [Streptomyces sp. RFCAC02]|uniref:mycothiol synthase n=1 Tax=Streptomyces sp. RFCAC02 TaxID=2499143 RepID=UPI00101F1381|nr:mycothiol synthase [Streptomyces sp. RFCAC02]